jgi:hypothetical protein
MASLSISMTSFLYVTYAWFTNKRVQEARLMEVRTEAGLDYSMRYFDGNYNTRDITTGTNAGYQSPTAVADPLERLGVTDYETDFDLVTPEMIAPESTNNPLLIVDIYPGIQYTFAIEVTSDLVGPRDISLLLKEYTSPGDPDILDSTTLEPISLSSAIDIYSTSINTYGKSAAQVTSEAHSFVQDLTPTDLFDYDDEGGTIYLPLAGDTIHQEEDLVSNKVIFLFTIKFSDSTSSYYQWVSYSGGVNYYQKSINGNSNVYQSKSFVINEFFVHLED